VVLALATACGRIGFGDVASGDGDVGGTRPSSSYEGTVLFVEPFEDVDFTSRGWYDSPAGVMSTAEHAPGSTASYECDWAASASSCTGGAPMRHALPATDPLYVSYWIKVSTGFAGLMGTINLITTGDGAYVGPFSSHLTVVLDSDNAQAAVQATDSVNVDTSCVQTAPSDGTLGTIIGCGGATPATYAYGSSRAVNGCNGVASDIDSVWCDDEGSNSYLNSAFRSSTTSPFSDGTWHFVEAFFAMNSVAGTQADADGVVRFWIDGALAVADDRATFRNGAEPTLEWNQLAVLPYIPLGGAPAAESVWLDELTVAVGIR